MQKILETVFTAAPLTVGASSLIVLFLVQYNCLQKTIAKSILFVVVTVISLISLFLFAFTIFSMPTTLLYPISLIIIWTTAKTKLSDIFLNTTLFIHSCNWVFVLILYTSNANTWGNTQALIGLVSVVNSMLFISFFMLHVRKKKWVAIFKIVAGVVASVSIYLWTNGFELGAYSGDDVQFARISAMFLCTFSIVEGALLFKTSI